MFDLLLTITIFIIVHMVPAVPPLRNALISIMGKGAYITGFSLMSLGLLGWVGIAYANAPYVELWVAPGWAYLVPVLLMPLACIFLVAVFTNPNPLSASLKSGGFNPARPGVVGITRHPLLWALILWSGAHLFANPDVASALLFGLFTLLGLVGPFSIDGRKRKKLGPDSWAKLSAPTSFVPFWAAISGRGKIDLPSIGWVTLVLGLVLYGVLVVVHGMLWGPDILDGL